MCCKQVIIEQIALQLPMMFAFHPTAEALGMRVFDAPLPSWFDSSV
jgi:hypothetical protein